MYTPDRNIVKRLKEYAPELDARWDRNRERWVVTFKGKDVITVMNDDRSYRPLDERVLLSVALSDAHRYERAGDIARLVDASNREVLRSQRRNVSNYLQAVAREDGYRSVFGGPQIRGWSPS